MGIKRRRASNTNRSDRVQAGKMKSAKADSAILNSTFSILKKYRLYILLAVLAGVPFLLGKYIEFNTPGPYDSGSYVYSAYHILDGAQFGVEEVSSAQPGTLFVNFIGVWLCGFSETGPKLMQTFLQLTALILMFFAIRKMCSPLAACVSVILAAVYLSAPVIAKFGNVKEQHMIAFMVIAASCFIIRQTGGGWWWSLLAGASAVNVYYFKQTGASVAIGIAVFLLVKAAFEPKKIRNVLAEVIFLTAGGAIGLIPLYSFYSWMGARQLFLKTVPVFTVGLIVNFIIFAFGVYVAVRLLIYIRIVEQLKKLRQVRLSIWIAGVLLIAVTMVPAMIYFNSRAVVAVDIAPDEVGEHLEMIESQGYMDYYRYLYKNPDDLKVERGGELGYYLRSVGFIKYPMKLITYPFGLVDQAANKFGGILKKATGGGGYVGESRKLLGFKAQSEKVFRFYAVLILPIFLAAASLIAWVIRLVLRVLRVQKEVTVADRLVVFLGVWWIVDMAFVWISPRSYEQYYLPLTASAAMLAGYVCSFYSSKLAAAKAKAPWYGVGVFCVFVMIIMSWNIFFGLGKSPHTGTLYKNRAGEPYKRFGFQQSLDRVAARKKGRIGEWETIGKYIGERTNEDDTIYVWGWYPGIYVQAQRLSSAPKAFESEMHTRTPLDLSRVVARILKGFSKNPPKYIVDSRKRHFPWNRPPLELWPSTTKGLLPNIPQAAEQFDAMYSKMLAEKIDDDEAARYEAMSPFRQFVMDNYEPVEEIGYVQTAQGKRAVNLFGQQHRVYRLKTNRAGQEPK